jgi:hypothetical protein
MKFEVFVAQIGAVPETFDFKDEQTAISRIKGMTGLVYHRLETQGDRTVVKGRDMGGVYGWFRRIDAAKAREGK